MGFEKEGGNRWWRELTAFSVFHALLSFSNIAILILVTLLLYQFILYPHQIIQATFWVIWALGWISISIMVATLKNRPGVLWILSGPIYLLRVSRPEIRVAVLSIMIAVVFNFVAFHMDDTTTVWYIMTTVASFAIVVFVNCLKQFFNKMELKMERDPENDPYVLSLHPVMGMMSSANNASQGIHHVIQHASKRKPKKLVHE